MQESKIHFNLPSLQTLERIEELQEYIRNFPESKLVPCCRRELEELEALAKHL